MNVIKATRSLQNESSFESLIGFLESLFNCVTPSPSPQPSDGFAGSFLPPSLIPSPYPSSISSTTSPTSSLSLQPSDGSTETINPTNFPTVRSSLSSTSNPTLYSSSSATHSVEFLRKLKPSCCDGDMFRYSIPLLNDVVAVSAPKDDDTIYTSSSVYFSNTTDGSSIYYNNNHMLKIIMQMGLGLFYHYQMTLLL